MFCHISELHLTDVESCTSPHISSSLLALTAPLSESSVIEFVELSECSENCWTCNDCCNWTRCACSSWCRNRCSRGLLGKGTSFQLCINIKLSTGWTFPWWHLPLVSCADVLWKNGVIQVYCCGSCSPWEFIKVFLTDLVIMLCHEKICRIQTDYCTCCMHMVASENCDSFPECQKWRVWGWQIVVQHISITYLII